MNKPQNIMEFQLLTDEIPLDLDRKTWRDIDKLAAARKTTRHAIILEALEVYVADFGIGEDLLGYIEQKIAKPADRPHKCAAQLWKQRIEKTLYRFTKNREVRDLPFPA